MTQLTWRKIILMKLFRAGFVIFTVLFCHVHGIQKAQESDLAIRARQTAAAVNDKPDTLEERQAALLTLEESANLFLKAGETVEAAHAMNRVGRLQFVMTEPNAAIETHNRALGLLKLRPSTEAEVDNLNGLAAAYMYLNKPDKAEIAIRRAIRLSEQSSYNVGLAESFLILSDRQNYENHLLALETAAKALALSETNNDKMGIAGAFFQIGQCNMALQRLPESKQSNERAYALWLELKSTRGQADALIALGQIEQRKGAWEDALLYFRQARSLLDDRAEPLRMGQISMGFGETHNGAGMREIGLIHLTRGLDYFQQSQKPDYVAYAISAIGKTQLLLGNYSEAITQLQKGFEGLNEGDSQTAEPHEWLGRVYIEMADYDVALEHLEAALAIYKKATNPMETAQVIGLMGKVYQQRGDVERARQYYLQAKDEFIRLDDRVNMAAIYFALGRLELKNDNLNDAEKYLRQSIEVTDKMRRVSTSSDLTAAFSATVHDRYESYVECLMRKHNGQPGKDFDVRAFEVSEQSRGRALVELLQATETGAAPGLEPQLAEQEKSLRQSLRVKEDSRVRLLAGPFKTEDLAAIDSEISQLETQYKQVLDTVRARYPAFEQINRPTAWDVHQIQEKVIADNETLLLEYSLGPDHSYVWAITRDSITSHELASEKVINEAAQKVYRLLARRPASQPTNELEQAIQELSQMILSPVANDLSKRRILVVADGALNYIPFQVLLSPTTDREQMLVAHEVINAPSASTLGQLRQETARRQPAANVLAAFGDPVLDTNFAQQQDSNKNQQLAYVQTPDDDRMQTAIRDVELNGDSFDPSNIRSLFYAKQELANLREVAGDTTLLATGFDASKEKLQSTDLAKYSVLHFATHGMLNTKRPEISGLVLSTVDRNGKKRNGLFGLSDIYNLHAPVDLVVLSACRTGLGKDVRGEGLIGITRGFMYAGASSVVASLWKVDDEATAELMKRFYTNLLKGGMTPAAALAAAQNSNRQQERWRSPYYWAAFTIQGDSRSVIRSSRTGKANIYENVVILTMLLALVGLVGLSYRYHLREMTTKSR